MPSEKEIRKKLEKMSLPELLAFEKSLYKKYRR
jgi:hypothetical protein